MPMARVPQRYEPKPARLFPAAALLHGHALRLQVTRPPPPPPGETGERGASLALRSLTLPARKGRAAAMLPDAHFSPGRYFARGAAPLGEPGKEFFVTAKIRLSAAEGSSYLTSEPS